MEDDRHREWPVTIGEPELAELEGILSIADSFIGRRLR
jgi:hypothetical protein